MYFVYSKPDCPRCVNAISALALRGLPFKEVKLGVDMETEHFKQANPTIRSVPFITLDDKEFTSVASLQKHLASLK